MLRIFVKGKELFDETSQEFINVNDTVLELEHSLISVSKWESKWHKPFISSKNKTEEETFDYVRCMTMNKGVSPYVYLILSDENIKDIEDYINDSQTALYMNDDKKGGSQKVITNEIIYSWMIQFGIPVQFEKWHLNRLLTLIKVMDRRTSPPGKRMTKREIMQRNSEINKARRKKLNSKG